MEIGENVLGAEAVLKALNYEGVDVVFGIPGGSVLPLYDAFFKQDKIRHILMRHEQGAIHAADGYARSTGKAGVCIVTSGPGATNLVTGLANAYMDSVPIVAFTGQVTRDFIGKDSFQETDITGITIPITKHNYLVKNKDDLLNVIHEAFYLATSGRPGPVLIDIPKDITTEMIDFDYPPPINLPGYKVYGPAPAEKIKEAVSLMEKSEKPLICAGGGVISANASELLFQLAEKLDAPVTTTLMGKGAFPETHERSLRMLGIHGTAYANYAVNECDLFLALGMRFDDRVTGEIAAFAPNADLIHVDIDPAEIGKNVKVKTAIVGNVKDVLAQILAELKPQKHPSWLQRIKELKAKYPLSYCHDGSLKPQYVVEKIWEVTEGKALITTEVGQHQMWAAHYYPCDRPRTFFSSGGLGTMGYGFPAALGVQIAHPEALVFDIAGDGSIQMNIQEMATAVHYKLPVKIAIMDNRYLGMVRQWQELFFEKRYAESDLGETPDFVKLAEAYGAVGIRVEKKEEVEEAIKKAIATPKPVIIDFLIKREENVYPMVPTGLPLTQMLGG